MSFRHPIYFAVCGACGVSVPAERREGWIEPPDGWAVLYPECCGMRGDRYACPGPLCPRVVVERMFASHEHANRLFVRRLGPVDAGEPRRFLYHREGARFRMEVLETG